MKDGVKVMILRTIEFSRVLGVLEDDMPPTKHEIYSRWRCAHASSIVGNSEYRIPQNGRRPPAGRPILTFKRATTCRNFFSEVAQNARIARQLGGTKCPNLHQAQTMP